MTTNERSSMMTIRLAAAIGAATLFGSLGLAGAAFGAGYSPQAVEAMGQRYEAMAQHYLGSQPSGTYSADALRALSDRWSAMARYYQQVELDEARRDAVAFDWLDAGIGALAAVGAVALLGLGAVGMRTRAAGRQTSATAS
jgi:hypothetical protein